MLARSGLSLLIFSGFLWAHISCSVVVVVGCWFESAQTIMLLRNSIPWLDLSTSSAMKLLHRHLTNNKTTTTTTTTPRFNIPLVSSWHLGNSIFQATASSGRFMQILRCLPIAQIAHDLHELSDWHEHKPNVKWSNVKNGRSPRVILRDLLPSF